MSKSPVLESLIDELTDILRENQDADEVLESFRAMIERMETWLDYTLIECDIIPFWETAFNNIIKQAKADVGEDE